MLLTGTIRRQIAWLHLKIFGKNISKDYQLIFLALNTQSGHCIIQKKKQKLSENLLYAYVCVNYTHMYIAYAYI